MAERIVSAKPHTHDGSLDLSLRPKTLSEYIGQDKVKGNLSIAVAASKKRGEALDHILLYGPPGLGKTTLANIIAAEMGVSIKTTSGPAVERAGDLAAIITNLKKDDILFIDEVHRLSRAVEEVLYPAMEDFALDIMIGKGAGARSLRLKLPRFTFVGATTRYAMVSAPLRNRFGAVYRLRFLRHCCNQGNSEQGCEHSGGEGGGCRTGRDSASGEGHPQGSQSTAQTRQGLCRGHGRRSHLKADCLRGSHPAGS